MTIKNRLKFIIGIVFVVLIVGVLVLYLNNALSTIRSSKAELMADTIAIGIDYPGLITKQNVSEGDKVVKGQTLFVVKSLELTKDLADKTVDASSLPFSVDKDTNDILVKATENGVIEKVNFLNGSYVPGGAVIASVYSVGTLYISGHYNLSPPDYARVKKGNQMSVTFPDNTKLEAVVYNIALDQDGSVVDTIVKARLQGADRSDFRFQIGTPVQASLSLTDRTWLQDVSDFVAKFVKSISV